MEERLKKMTLEIEKLRRENQALKQRCVRFGEDVAPIHNGQNEVESQRGRLTFDDEEMRKILNDLTWTNTRR